MKKLIVIFTFLFLLCKSAFTQTAADPEVCFLNAISKLNVNSQVYTWEIRDSCMKIFLQYMEKKAIQISPDQISQATLNVSSYGDGYLEVSLKNNSNLNVLYATIGITNISSGEVDRYRFIPIRSDIITPLSAGVLRGQTKITKDRVQNVLEFSTKYKWHFVNVFGYQY